MFYTAAWCVKDEKSFKETVPLKLLGQSIQKYGSSIKMRLVILEGYDRLSKEYISELFDVGLDVLDYSEKFKEIVARFPSIDKNYSNYNRNCFLRWIAFKNIMQSEGMSGQFWHLDGDVFYTLLWMRLRRILAKRLLCFRDVLFLFRFQISDGLIFTNANLINWIMI